MPGLPSGLKTMDFHFLQPMRARLWLFFCVRCCGGAWGLTPSLARLATAEGADPLGLALWQGVLGGAILALLALLRRRPLPLSRAHLVFYVMSGNAGTLLPNVVMFSAAPHISVGAMSMLISTVPLSTYVQSVLVRIDRVSLGRVTGIALGAAAMVLLIAPGGEPGAGSAVQWLLIALIIPVSFGFESVYVALRRPPGADVLTLLAGMLLAGGLMLAPVVLLTGSTVSLYPPWGMVEWATVGMVLCNLGSYATFLYLIGLAGPVFATQSSYFVTLFGILWGMLIFSERHPLWFWVALGLLFAGMALVKERPVGGGGRGGFR